MGLQRPESTFPVRDPAPSARGGSPRPTLAAALLGILVMGCAQPGDEAAARLATSRPAQEAQPAGAPQTGVASYYAGHFTGRRTASGERFDPRSDTVAHRTLPFGTVVRVTNLHNGLSTTGRVQDRGPWTRGRIVDLSPRLAREIGMIRSGVAQVEVVPLEEVAEAPQ